MLYFIQKPLICHKVEYSIIILSQFLCVYKVKQRRKYGGFFVKKAIKRVFFGGFGLFSRPWPPPPQDVVDTRQNCRAKNEMKHEKQSKTA